jgi:hypothetical protein
MKEIKAPNKIPARDQNSEHSKYLFLAGSIELGAAECWQDAVIKKLEHTEWIILNPRREYWDHSWEQTKENPKFREQVEWELNGQEMADKILMYFDPATKSPISLLELGLFESTHKMIVVFPEGYGRNGNVDIVCERYGVLQSKTIEEAIGMLNL